MIFEIFSPKNLAKNWRFLLKILQIFEKCPSQHWFVRKTQIFSQRMGKNRRKL
jgi:hypothetical protein